MGGVLAELLANRVLMGAIIAWTLAQVIKVPLNFALHREWDWSLVLSSGGMPSSHTALVAGVTVGIGLQEGFA